MLQKGVEVSCERYDSQTALLGAFGPVLVQVHVVSRVLQLGSMNKTSVSYFTYLAPFLLHLASLTHIFRRPEKARSCNCRTSEWDQQQKIWV